MHQTNGQLCLCRWLFFGAGWKKEHHVRACVRFPMVMRAKDRQIPIISWRQPAHRMRSPPLATGGGSIPRISVCLKRGRHVAWAAEQPKNTAEKTISTPPEYLLRPSSKWPRSFKRRNPELVACSKGWARHASHQLMTNGRNSRSSSCMCPTARAASPDVSSTQPGGIKCGRWWKKTVDGG